MSRDIRNKTSKPAKAYEKLLSNYGPQGWWPVTKRGSLTPEYRSFSEKRTGERERFEICIGAILTQNTAWRNVEKALANLNRENLIIPGKLSLLKRNYLASLIRPSGYYNQKADRLIKFDNYFKCTYKGGFEEFFSKPLNVIRSELLSLEGIGPETADSILLYAGNKKTFVVDTYTKRVGSRGAWFKTDCYNVIKEYLERNIPSSIRVYNEFHALIVLLGKEYCRKTPVCLKCPLVKNCKTGKKLNW